MPGSNDNLYAAIRPLVDAFAKHAEYCKEYAADGKTCVDAQNGVQILADLLQVFHKHWPSEQSSRFKQSFIDTYGPDVYAKGAGLVSFEPLVAKLLKGDLWPASIGLTKSLRSVQVDGLPLAVVLDRIGLFTFVPPASNILSYRDGTATALRIDGKPAYHDAALAKVLGYDPTGRVTNYYLIKSALRKASDALDASDVASKNAKRALGDVADLYLATEKAPVEMCNCYRFKNRSILPMASILNSFAAERVAYHYQSPLPTKLNWPGRSFVSSNWNVSFMQDVVDLIQGQMYAAAVDLGTKIDKNDLAKLAINQLLHELLSTNDPTKLDAIALAVADGAQVLASEEVSVPLARGIAQGVDTDGPVVSLLRLAKQGRELAAARSAHTFPYTLISQASTPVCNGFLTPALRYLQAVKNIKRVHPEMGIAPLENADVVQMLQETADFLRDKDSGAVHILDIVRSR